MARVSESDLIVPITRDADVVEASRSLSMALPVALPVDVVAVLLVMLILIPGSTLHLSSTNWPFLVYARCMSQTDNSLS